MNAIFWLLQSLIFLVASSHIAIAETSPEVKFTEWLHAFLTSPQFKTFITTFF
ncbi:MAG: hypothetical protein PHN45_02620 [Methylococcales bacterium]|nr:hypothetical protein [Methylococcales bacterium]MDD5753624.1 hypothetical protein [Methylococcales bacterium]